jgi:hypothetical protein
MSERSFARRRDRSPASRAFTLELCRALVDDERFATLKPRGQAVLLCGLVKWSDGDGKWYPKLPTLAAVLGMGVRTVSRAITDAETIGLVSREPYLRPDGLQGSTIYRVDPALLEVAHAAVGDAEKPSATPGPPGAMSGPASASAGSPDKVGQPNPTQGEPPAADQNDVNAKTERGSSAIPDIPQEIHDKLVAHGLTEWQLADAARAYRENSAGVETLLVTVETAKNPPAALMAQIKEGAHTRLDQADLEVARMIRERGYPTGVSWVRGTHSGSWRFDPLGYEKLPWDYDDTGSGIHRPTHAEIIAAIREGKRPK